MGWGERSWRMRKGWGVLTPPGHGAGPGLRRPCRRLLIAWTAANGSQLSAPQEGCVPPVQRAEVLCAQLVAQHAARKLRML